MLENFLRVRLKKKLPGVIEQNKMSPIPLKNGYLKSIKKDHKTGSILIIFYKKNNEFYFPLKQIYQAKYSEFSFIFFCRK